MPSLLYNRRGLLRGSDEYPDSDSESDANLENGRHHAANQCAFSDASGISCRRSTREFRNECPDKGADKGANYRADDRNWKSDHRTDNTANYGTPSCTTRAAVFPGIAARHRDIQQLGYQRKDANGDQGEPANRVAGDDEVVRHSRRDHDPEARQPEDDQDQGENYDAGQNQ